MNAPDPSPIGVLVVGLGFVAGGYLEHFSRSNRTCPVIGADLDPDARQRATASYGLDASIERYQDGLDRDDIHLVVVCTPHHLHHPIVTEALRAGKDVICEKPIAISTEEADQMIDLAAQLGRTLLVSLDMRYGPDALKLQQLIRCDTLGRIFWARASYLGYETTRFGDPTNWRGDLERAGGGVLLDGGYHVVDLLNTYLGPAKSVQAQGGRLVVEAANKGEDNVGLLVEYESGAIADLVASFTTRNVGCDEAPTLFLSMDLSGTDGTVFSGYDSTRLKRHFDVVTTTKREEIDLSSIDAPAKNDHFLDCVTKGETPLATALEARNAVAVVEAAYESMRTGSRVMVAWRG